MLRPWRAYSLDLLLGQTELAAGLLADDKEPVRAGYGAQLDSPVLRLQRDKKPPPPAGTLPPACLLAAAMTTFRR